MNILAIGDLVGRSGIKEMRKRLNEIKQKENIDFVIVNAERIFLNL